MRTRLSLFLMACLTVVAVSWAGTIDEGQARTIAQRFAVNRAMPVSGLEMVKKSTRLNATQSNARAAFYVFNGKRVGSGFIIISGDDRVPAVLGYSDHGTFDVDDVPAALADMLENYAAQIEALDQGVEPRLLTSRQPISPMVPSMWSQNSPFNNKLPFVGSEQAVWPLRWHK